MTRNAIGSLSACLKIIMVWGAAVLRSFPISEDSKRSDGGGDEILVCVGYYQLNFSTLNIFR